MDLIVLVIVVGGTKRLVQVTERLVPVMALIYVIGALVVIGVNIDKLPEMCIRDSSDPGWYAAAKAGRGDSGTGGPYGKRGHVFR